MRARQIPRLASTASLGLLSLFAAPSLLTIAPQTAAAEKNNGPRARRLYFERAPGPKRPSDDRSRQGGGRAQRPLRIGVVFPEFGSEQYGTGSGGLGSRYAPSFVSALKERGHRPMVFTPRWHTMTAEKMRQGGFEKVATCNFTPPPEAGPEASGRFELHRGTIDGVEVYLIDHPALRDGRLPPGVDPTTNGSVYRHQAAAERYSALCQAAVAAMQWWQVDEGATFDLVMSHDHQTGAVPWLAARAPGLEGAGLVHVVHAQQYKGEVYWPSRVPPEGRPRIHLGEEAIKSGLVGEHFYWNRLAGKVPGVHLATVSRGAAGALVRERGDDRRFDDQALGEVAAAAKERGAFWGIDNGMPRADWPGKGSWLAKTLHRSPGGGDEGAGPAELRQILEQRLKKQSPETLDGTAAKGVRRQKWQAGRLLLAVAAGLRLNEESQRRREGGEAPEGQLPRAARAELGRLQRLDLAEAYCDQYDGCRDLVIVSPNRLGEDKGTGPALAAIRRVLEADRESPVRVIAMTSPTPETAHFVRELERLEGEFPGRVIYLQNFRPWFEELMWLGGDLHLHIPPHEQGGLTAKMAALYRGVNNFLSDVGGHKGTLRPEGSPYDSQTVAFPVANPDDVDAVATQLCKAVNLFCNDRAAWLEMADKAREIADKYFPWDHQIKRYEEMMEKAIKDRRAQPEPASPQPTSW